MPAFMLDMDDLEGSFVGATGTFGFDPTGTLVHRPTGARFSEDTGITVDGQTYSLTAADIELDGTHLGAGAGGVVQKGMIKATGQRVAVKGIKIDTEEKKKQLLGEVQILIGASSEWCPNVVTWHGGFITKTVVHVVLELCDLGSLRNLMQRLPAGGQVPPEYCGYVSHCSLVGLKFLHDRTIVHRDIKPENILHCSDGAVKITDFGISRSLEGTIAMAGTQVGTQIYMSPEMCLGETYSFEVDVWAYGLVLHELATGTFPFPSVMNFPELYQAICEDPEPRLHPDYPYPMQEFVACCLTRDVSQRWPIPNLLEHGFVQGVPAPEQFAAWVNGG